MTLASANASRRRPILLMAIVGAVAVPAGSQQLAAGSVLGRVLDAVTGQPIAAAQVTLAKLADGAAQPPAAIPKTVIVTNGDGSLSFRELSSGQYSVTVTATGYLAGGYLQGSAVDTRVHPIVLREGERRTDVDVRLWKLGSIAGTVLDETGRPAGANVSILRRGYTAGRVTLMPAATAMTDDRGSYAAGGLPPADYVVGIRASQLTVRRKRRLCASSS